MLSGLLFGWAHVDDEILNPAIHAPFAMAATVMALNSLLGVLLGWLYWKQGLECAIIAHFLADALAVGMVVPIFLSAGTPARIALVLGLVLAAAFAWRMLARTGSNGAGAPQQPVTTEDKLP